MADSATENQNAPPDDANSESHQNNSRSTIRAITDLFIRRPVLAIVVNLTIVLIGLSSISSLPIQQYPSLESTSIIINTYYIGASAETVRGFLTTPIEQAVSSIAGVDYIESSSTAGASQITIRLKLNHDRTQALAEVTARLQQVRRQLPAEAEPPVVESQCADKPYATFYISFTSEQFDLPALTDWCSRNIQPQLSTLSGVQRIGVEAGQSPAMRIWISPQQLGELNLTPGDVYSALQRNNYVAAIGRLKSDDVQIVLGGALRLHWSIAFSTVLIALAAPALYMFSAKELAPIEDQSAIAVIMQAAPNSTLESSTRWTQELADDLEALPESEFMWALAMSSGGFGGITTKPFDERSRTTEEMYPEVFGIVSAIPGISPFPVLIPPLPGAGQFDVELVIKSDQPVEQLAESIDEIVSRGRQAGMFTFVDTDLKLGSLMDLKIRGPGGDLIPVSSFASITSTTAPRILARFQQQSSLRVFAGVFPGVTKEQGLNTLEGIARDVLGTNATIDYAGESRQIKEEGSALIASLLFALILIYLVLSAQFHSFRDPLIVLLGSVPLAISGALMLTFLGLTTINIYSQVGLITLVGLVAKNGILIVEFANSLQAAGRTRWAAIHEAAQTRLRPVLMTSAATVFGHFPLVLVAGPGARNSIGIVLVAGMAIGTFFTLFVVPALYVLIAARHKHDDAESFSNGG